METEKITLYNSKLDILIKLNVPVRDALRARNDINFAKTLINAALQEKDSLTDQSAPAVTESSEAATPTEEEIVHNTDHEEEDPCIGGHHRLSFFCWTVTGPEKKNSQTESLLKKIWEEVADVLQIEGHNVSGPQCAAKMRSFKKTYKSIEDHNSKSGNDRRTWQIHEVIDSVFAKKAWCSPVALAPSSGLCVQPGSAEDVTSDSEIALAPSTRLLKANIAAMLKKRIRQKEEHEKAREKRHRERMEMDEKLLVVVQKLAGNK